jgi:hypothetical protein
MNNSDIRMFWVTEFYVKFGILDATNRHIAEFRNAMARGLLDRYQHFE